MDIEIRGFLTVLTLSVVTVILGITAACIYGGYNDQQYRMKCVEARGNFVFIPASNSDSSFVCSFK